MNEIRITLANIELVFNLQTNRAWLMRPDGEGMEIGLAELDKLLEQYLSDNF